MSKPENQRVVLLNRMLSLSSSRAPNEHKPPILTGLELLQILQDRWEKGWAIEFLNSLDNDDEAERIKLGANSDAMRLRQFRFEKHNGRTYALLLIEHVDQTVRSFPVVHTATYEGREISGDDYERGATSAHLVIKLPGADNYDDGNYRCAFEYVSPISRLLVERFISRQIKRQAEKDEWTFGVMVQAKGKKGAIEKPYRYTPKVHLVADVGRKLGGPIAKDLSLMVFTKRSEKQSIGKATETMHQDVFADVEFRIPAKQAPSDAQERKTWFSGIRNFYEQRGFTTKLYYRHAGGATVVGGLHHDVANAADLMMCHREVVTLSAPVKRWQSAINDEMTTRLRELLDKDDLWQLAT